MRLSVLAVTDRLIPDVVTDLSSSATNAIRTISSNRAIADAMIDAVIEIVFPTVFMTLVAVEAVAFTVTAKDVPPK